MTLNTIEQTLNLAITGLIYGSEFWLIYAFSRFVLKKRKEKPAKPTIEITIEPSPLKQSSIQHPPSPIIQTQPAEPALPPTIQPVAKPITQPPAIPQITCPPVNWKQWKVADLRKASIAKTCGVRTRPIGSNRNLRKADLIAQYEQQLKRLTKTPPPSTMPAQKTA